MQLNPHRMALTTAKFSELPLRSTLCRPHSPSFSLLSRRSTIIRPCSSSVRTSKSRGKPPSQNPHKSPSSSSSSSSAAAPWLSKWPKMESSPADSGKSSGQDRPRGAGLVEGGRTQDAIEKIVLRLRNLGLGGEDEEEEGDEVEMEELTGEEKLGDLLKKDWLRPDTMLVEEDEGDEETLLPWEKGDGFEEEAEVDGQRMKKRTVKAPSLAELTIEDSELRRLRRMGMILRERVNVAKAGVTQAVLEKIHEKWRKTELVRLRFHESLAHDMKTAHEIVERRSGGLVIWRSGSVMVVYRGNNYEGPVTRLQDANRGSNVSFIPDVSATKTRNTENGASLNTENTSVTVIQNDDRENMTPEELEFDALLDGLGPRFIDWWGTGILPIDADLLPETIPDFKPPLRLLPVGMRSRLTNDELTDLRKHAKSLPCHFALGRNRHHQGLAAAIIKIWETTLVVKIAVKRGIQNTNNELMAEELKRLTGGTLMLRNKFYIVIYRGKDFLPSSVAMALAERQELTKQIQDAEEMMRSRAVQAAPSSMDGPPLAGTLAEFYEAQARWGREITTDEHEKMIEEASRAKRLKAIKRVEHKLALAQTKMQRAEKLLSKIESSMVPIGPSDDQETVTDEEKFMYRRVGLRMKAYLPVGIRGIFDGVIENMHLHWKHRELVKLISKQKNLAFVEETARLLEYESGGILVAIEPVPKGFALIYYRGKNYQRPVNLRPRNLLTKAKALKRAIAMQRHEALTQHITELEKNIEQMKIEIGDLGSSRDDSTLSSDGAADFSESEDEEFDEEDEYLDKEDDSDDFL
ncbi:hypothetical protein V2J09_017469 [Rumex salicifolius]